MHYPHLTVFYLLSLIAVLIFTVKVVNLISLIRLGKGPAPSYKFNLVLTVKAVLSRVLLQTQLYRQSRLRWFMHISIYWGFVALFLQTFLMTLLNWVIPSSNPIAVFFLQDWGSQLLNFWGDFWGLLMLVGLAIALVRRYVIPSGQLNTLAEDAVTLWFLLFVVLTGFFAEGVRISLENITSGVDYSFIGMIAAKLNIALFNVKSKMVMFWVHGLVSLAFIAYLPYSKLVHIFTAPVEISLSSYYKNEDGINNLDERGVYIGGKSQTTGVE